MRRIWTAAVPAGAGSGSCGGRAPGRSSSRRSRSASRSNGLRVSAAGSSQRSRNTVSRSRDRRSADGELDVVPRRPRPVHRGHRLRAAGRRRARRRRGGCGTGRCRRRTPRPGPVGPGGAARRTSGGAIRRADPHVPQALAAGRLDVLAEMPVLLLAEREAIQVGAPEQALDHARRVGGAANTRRPRCPAAVSSSSGSPRQSVNSSRSPGAARRRGGQLGEVRLRRGPAARAVADVYGSPPGWRGSSRVTSVAPLASSQEPLGLDGAPPHSRPTGPGAGPGRNRPGAAAVVVNRVEEQQTPGTRA